MRIKGDFFIIAVVALVGGGCFLWGRKTAPRPEAETVIERDTIIRAVAVPSPRAEAVKPIRPQVFPVPVSEVRTEHDTVFVVLERTQAKYDSAGVYTAYVSGIDPRLDSLTIYDHTITEVVTVREPVKVWRHNIGIGAEAVFAKTPTLSPEIYYRYQTGRWAFKGAVSYDMVAKGIAAKGTVTFDFARF